MANANHLELFLQGVDAWNAWREKEPWVKPDLTGADFSRANLIVANLIGAKLCRANLIDGELRGAKLVGADVIGALLVWTNWSR